MYVRMIRRVLRLVLWDRDQDLHSIVRRTLKFGLGKESHMLVLDKFMEHGYTAIVPERSISPLSDVSADIAPDSSGHHKVTEQAADLEMRSGSSSWEEMSASWEDPRSVGTSRTRTDSWASVHAPLNATATHTAHDSGATTSASPQEQLQSWCTTTGASVPEVSPREDDAQDLEHSDRAVDVAAETSTPKEEADAPSSRSLATEADPTDQQTDASRNRDLPPSPVPNPKDDREKCASQNSEWQKSCSQLDSAIEAVRARLTRERIKAPKRPVPIDWLTHEIKALSDQYDSLLRRRDELEQDEEELEQYRHGLMQRREELAQQEAELAQREQGVERRREGYVGAIPAANAS